MFKLPKSREEIAQIQSVRKREAVERALRSRFWAPKLANLRLERLDDPDEWRRIPILDKDMLRELSDAQFYQEFCIAEHDGVAEYWRSGGVTGKPLFYPRSFSDIEVALESFARTFDCAGLGRGERAHISFPMGIHPVGQIYARCATARGIAVNWAGSGAGTSSALQLELMQRLKPTIWLGMSSYALHLANLAEACGVELSRLGIRHVMCSAEPVSQAKRDKIERAWGARLTDNFGMTEAGMMGAEDRPAAGFRIWTDLYFIEILDPVTMLPAREGEVGTLIVTALCTNNITPFLRWRSGDLVTYAEADDGAGPFSVFPLVRHAHRTVGFFKVRGVNLGHQDLEDLMFRQVEIGDFRAEVLNEGGTDLLKVSVEVHRGRDAGEVSARVARLIRDTFELTPRVVILDAGTLAREFEANVKAARFVDRRSE
jgi:phenylacetate-CoA ligase